MRYATLKDNLIMLRNIHGYLQEEIAEKMEKELRLFRQRFLRKE
jgi:hypothetical protein